MPLVIGTSGHIDHGKSALVKALTGIDPDRLKEEQVRGITIDLGFAHAVVDGVETAFVDVPGHERFVRHMLAGACGLDAVLLVVAADESVMPQTREHFEICRLLGLERGLIVLTKADLADEAVRAVAAAEVRDLVRGSFLEHAPVIPVSSRTGEGLETLRAAIASLAGRPPRQGTSGLARVPIDRVFVMKGFGTVVTGTLVSGRIHVGEVLDAHPAGGTARVRGIQVHGRPVEVVDAPSRAALNLGGIERDELARGVTLCAPGALVVTKRFDSRIELLAGSQPLRHGARLRVHHGTSELQARVAIGAVRATRDEEWRQPWPGEASCEVPPGGEAYVRLRLEHPTAITRRDRVVLRQLSPSVTIGGGWVLDPQPPSAGLRRTATLERFKRMDGPGDASDADARCIRAWLSEAGEAGLDESALVARSGRSPDAIKGFLAAAIREGGARRLLDRTFAATVMPAMTSRVLAVLSAFHAAHPEESGMPRESLRGQAGAGGPAVLFDTVIDELRTAGSLSGGDRLSLAAHRHEASSADRTLAETLEAHLLASGLSVPDLEALARGAGAPLAEVDRLVQRLVREKRLVRVETLLFHPAVLEGLKRDVRALGAASRIDVPTFKQRFGLSRKYAIPLLEWLDRERITRRVGEAREVLK